MTAAPMLHAAHPASSADSAKLGIFARAANAVSRVTGKPITFMICCLTIVVWAVTGPLFHYSDTWQLIINTGTTIITFLMVFLIQNTQNRDGAALQAKLDELIRATQAAHNELISAERLPEKELERIRAQTCGQAETHFPGGLEKQRIRWSDSKGD